MEPATREVAGSPEGREAALLPDDPWDCLALARMAGREASRLLDRLFATHRREVQGWRGRSEAVALGELLPAEYGGRTRAPLAELEAIGTKVARQRELLRRAYRLFREG